ncbi:MAG: hypothetical protein H0V05_16220, partial [Euzebyaceae bacterium]|nr:hypothetical protein [Euzebyaceae bacterium]
MQGFLAARHRAGTAATLVAVMLAGLVAVAAPARAQAGSIVFIKDGNVWVMAADDPSTARA